MLVTVPYFSKPETTALIAQIAERKRLTLVIGAGWSADWGLPSWRELVSRLLQEHVAIRYGIYPSADREDFSRKILDSHDLVGAASIVRESLDEQFGEALRHALYKNRVGTFGNAALAVADVYYAWRARTDRQVTIVTTNYDTALEKALDLPIFEEARCAQGITSVDTVATPEQATALVPANQREHSVPVFHLHGVLPISDPAQGPLVFSEEDYTLQVQGGRWQDALLRACLHDRRNVCLFLGMSLSDPNVLRHLFKADRKKMGMRPLFFLPNQSRSSSPSVDPIRSHVERAERQRLARIGVSKESPNYFSQVPQLLREVSNTCQALNDQGRDSKASAHSESYAARLDRWRRSMEQAEPPRFDLDSDKQFASIQKVNHDVLQKTRTLLYYIVRDFRESQHVRERFAVQLWARNPDGSTRGLEMWGSSEKAWLERETILRTPIERDSSYNAVRAFCAGGSLIEPTAKAESRWAFSLASVVYLGGAWKALPVGVMVLESSFDEDESCLRFLNSAQRYQVTELLRRTGGLLLRPDVPAGTLDRALRALLRRREGVDIEKALRKLATVTGARSRT